MPTVEALFEEYSRAPMPRMRNWGWPLPNWLSTSMLGTTFSTSLITEMPFSSRLSPPITLRARPMSWLACSRRWAVTTISCTVVACISALLWAVAGSAAASVRTAPEAPRRRRFMCRSIGWRRRAPLSHGPVIGGADTVVRPRFRLRRKCRTDVLPGDGKAGVEAGRATYVAVSQPQKKQLFDNDFAVELGCNALMTLI
ncbi:hypothetical protein D3C85_898080 [compost metagenome]